MDFETTRCVVLNYTYEPISVVTSKRALLLILEEKAVIVEEHPTMIVRSQFVTLKVPVVVALKRFVKGRKIFRTNAVLTQKNLFIRDSYTCQYCSRHKSQLRSFEFLTRDHIIPESRGGKDIWENVVTACSTCNNKKANHNLEDTNLVLQKKPTSPTLFELWMRNSQKKLSMYQHT